MKVREVGTARRGIAARGARRSGRPSGPSPRSLVSVKIDRLCIEAGLSDDDVAEALKVDPITITNKRAGRRWWHLLEVPPLLELLSARLERPVTFEEVFRYPVPAKGVRRRPAISRR